MHDCFADEIAIDFPSVDHVVDRMRAAFLGGHVEAGVVAAEVCLSHENAWRGTVVPVLVPIRGLCPLCGGRGGTWAEACGGCRGTGDWLFHHPVRVAVPARVSDGARFRFRVGVGDAAPVRVEVRVAIRNRGGGSGE